MNASPSFDRRDHRGQLRPLPSVPVERTAEQAAAERDAEGRQTRPLHLTPQAKPGQRVLYTHPLRADVLMERTADGMDYHLFCRVHEYAGPAVIWYADVGICPLCLADIEGQRGHERYLALRAVMG